MKQIKKELTPVAVTGRPAVELKFIPPVTLSYESTLDLKPLPGRQTKAKSGGARSKRTTAKGRSTKKSA